jgi:hypothetical protein
MSRCCCKNEMQYKPMVGGLGLGFGGGNNCCCNFPMLVILILIVLQFSKKKKNYDRDDCDRDCEGGWGDNIGNGVLFIIALYFLSCCNPCKTSY